SDPVVGGISAGVNHLECRLDGAAFGAATSPVSFTALSEGSHTFEVRAVDNVGNVGVATSFTWTVDLTPPVVVAISRQAPAAIVTNATSVTFQVTLSEPVTGVDPTDFALVKTGAIATALLQTTLGMTGGGSVFLVTISGVTGSGALGVNLV